MSAGTHLCLQNGNQWKEGLTFQNTRYRHIFKDAFLPQCGVILFTTLVSLSFPPNVSLLLWSFTNLSPVLPLLPMVLSFFTYLIWLSSCHIICYGCLLLLDGWLLGLLFKPTDGGSKFHPKPQWTSAEPHGITSQTAVLILWRNVSQYQFPLGLDNFYNHFTWRFAHVPMRTSSHIMALGST